MASELGEAFVPIRATLDKLDKDLDAARGKVAGAMARIGKVAEGVSRNLQSVGKIALGGIGALGGAAASAAVGMAALAANAEPLVGLQQGFAAVTARIGTSSETMLAALQAASGGLITNRDLMQSFNQAAALVSDDFASKLPDAMGLVRKAAQATGQDMGFLFDSLVKGVGRVSPMILDNLGIQIALADVTDRAAQMFGKQAAELSKTEQQAALTEIVMEKLNAAYGDVPDAAPVFARIGVAIANLKDKIGLMLLPVLAPLAEKMLALADKILPVLFDVLEGKIIPVIARVAAGIQRFVSYLIHGNDVFSAVQAALGRMGFADLANKLDAPLSKMRSFIGTIGGLIDGARKAVGPIAEMIARFVEWEDVIVAVIIAIGFALSSAIKSVVSAAGPLVATLGAVIAVVALVRRAWEENWFGIQEKAAAAIAFLQPHIKGMIAWFQEFAPQAVQFLSDVFTNVLVPAIQTVQAVFNAVWPTIRDVVVVVVTEIVTFAQELFGQLVAWFTENLPLIQQTIQTVLEAVRNFWDQHGQRILNIVLTVWETIKTIISTALAVALGIIRALMQIINGDWDGAWQTIKNIVGTIWDGIKALVSGALDVLKNIIPMALDFIGALWSARWAATKAIASEAWEQIKSLISDAIEAVKQTISTVLDGISSAWSEGWDAIKQFASEAWETITDLISTAIDTIKKSINDGLKAVRAIFEFIWDGIVSTVTGVWEDIKSIVQGGIEAAAGILEGIVGRFADAGRAIVDAIKRGIEGAWQGIKNWFKSKLDELANMLPFSEPRDPASPLRGLSESGSAFWGNWLAGAQAAFNQVHAQIGNMAFDLDRLLSVPLVGAEMANAYGNVTHYTSTTTVNTNRDPLQVLRASRHLDRLGTT